MGQRGDWGAVHVSLWAASTCSNHRSEGRRSRGAWGGLEEEVGRTGGTGRGAEQGGEPSASLPTLAHPAHCPQCICTDSPPFNPSDNLYFFMQNYLMLRLLCRCNAMHWSPNISTLEVQSSPNTLSTPAFAPQR